MTTLSRRKFLYATGAAAAATLSAPLIARAAGETIKVGCLHDLSGALDSVGVPMNQVLQLAIKDINDNGGLLGKPVEAVVYDPQSNMSLYSQYATQLALKDKVDVVMAGSPRPAVKPSARSSTATTPSTSTIRNTKAACATATRSRSAPPRPRR